jgi:hypothetical protein
MAKKIMTDREAALDVGGVLLIVDVAEQARRLFGEEGADYIAGRPLPEHDYRFVVEYEHGSTTYGLDTTARQVAQDIEDRRAARRLPLPPRPPADPGRAAPDPLNGGTG